MMTFRLTCLALLFLCQTASAQVQERVIGVPTRGGVTQRILLVAPDNAKATILTDDEGPAVPEMNLEKLTIPVLVAHPKQDALPALLVQRYAAPDEQIDARRTKRAAHFGRRHESRRPL